MILTSTFFDSSLYTYFLLPLLIFLSRILDVSFGTIRIVMVSKGQKIWAPILGFFEVLVWLLAISRIFENLDNWVCYFAYAAGFATGNYIGLIIEERLALGIVKIQIITKKSATDLIQNLINAGYGTTYHEAKGSTENVNIIHSIVKRSEIEKVESLIQETNPKAFYSIEDIKTVSHGIFPERVVTRRWRPGK